MGVMGSKQRPARNPYAGRKKDVEKKYQKVERDESKIVMSPTAVQESKEKPKESPRLSGGYSNVSDDEFYDGIPRYEKSLYEKSRSSRATKVSEVGSILSRAGSVGLGRAVEVLDTLGSSVNLNLKGGFVSGASNKNNELSILGFEVANTVVKGSNIMQSLSKRSIRQLKEVVLPEEGVQNLISNDIDELLSIVASDKREELKVFAGEVIRFGNRCKDPQWHNLDRFFEKRSRDRTPQNQLRERAEAAMLQLMTSVQLTAELYQELHALDKFEQDYQSKRMEELRFNAGQRGDRDNSLNILSGKLKSQRKLVKSLKKKSLWCRSMEEVMETLVDIVLFLNQEINYTFGNPGGSETPEEGNIKNQQKLGPAGLALHYANIILLIDAIVARPSAMDPEFRDSLYQSLPPNLRDSLWSKLQSFHVEKEISVTGIKDEMEKTLRWLIPVATNTAKAHHGFGWVGEWANTGSELNHRVVEPNDVMQIETLHHASKQKTEVYILDLLAWLNYLVRRCKGNRGGAQRRSVKSHVRSVAKDTSKSITYDSLVEESNKEKLDDNEEIATKEWNDVLISHSEKSLDVSLV
ncbi:hypothetical protein ACS0TY_029594 [Phlomoides rotata]